MPPTKFVPLVSSHFLISWNVPVILNFLLQNPATHLLYSSWLLNILLSVISSQNTCFLTCVLTWIIAIPPLSLGLDTPSSRKQPPLLKLLILVFLLHYPLAKMCPQKTWAETMSYCVYHPQCLVQSGHSLVESICFLQSNKCQSSD